MIELQNLHKDYASGGLSVPVLRGISLHIARGEFCSVMGASGSGKTTLMNIIGLLDRPSSGSFIFQGIDVAAAAPDVLADLRNHQIGFVFQSFHLLPWLTALDNVALPLLYRGIPKRDRRPLALERLAQVGLAERAQHRPEQLSGGQRQRVAIARALIGKPAILLADEPTGSLDSRAAQDIMALLTGLNAEIGLTVVIVTHDPAVSAQCPRRILVRDGMVIEDSAAVSRIEAQR